MNDEKNGFTLHKTDPKNTPDAPTVRKLRSATDTGKKLHLTVSAWNIEDLEAAEDESERAAMVSEVTAATAARVDDELGDTPGVFGVYTEEEDDLPAPETDEPLPPPVPSASIDTQTAAVTDAVAGQIFIDETITATDLAPKHEEPQPASEEQIDREFAAVEESALPFVFDGEEEEPAPEAPAYDPEKPRHVDNRFDFVEIVVFTLAVILILTSFLFRHSVVEGDSMQNTFQNGQHLIISDVFYKPKQGDVIVFEDYEAADRIGLPSLRKPLIKRVIATAGQTVRIASEGVYVDDVLLEEDYVFIDGYFGYYPQEVTVPEGCVFVMGDHRNESTDSRVFGVVKEEAIIGRVLFRFYPLEDFGIPDT